MAVIYDDQGNPITEFPQIGNRRVMPVVLYDGNGNIAGNKVAIWDGENTAEINSSGQLHVIAFDSDGNESNPDVAKSYRWNEEDQSWDKNVITNKGVHLCASDIDATQGFVLIDLSDTTNFPHNYSGNLCLTGYQISINPDDSFTGQVLVGFLENVDATNGDFKPLICWKLEKKSSNIIDSLAFNNPICATSGNFLVPGNTDDATWQTDTALASPLDNTAPYTTAPGDGDLVMKIVRTAGEVNVGVTLKYYSQA